MTTEFPGQVPSSTPAELLEAKRVADEAAGVDDRDAEIARLQAEIDRRNDPKAKQLADLRRQLAELDAADNVEAKPAPAEAVVRSDGLVGPAHTAWDDVPKAGDIPLDQIQDPTVRYILQQLQAERRESERLRRMLATQGAPSNDAAPAQTAVLHLANGRVVRHASAIPTHHFDAVEDGGDGKLHRVLSGHFENDNDAPAAE